MTSVLKDIYSKYLILSLAFISLTAINIEARDKYNFNSDWLLKVGDIEGA